VVADKVSGLTAVYAVTSALLQRERGGGGQEIDVPMFETMASFLMVEHLTGAVYTPSEGRPVYPRSVSPERRPFATRDGYISVLAYNDKQWRAFADIAGRPELKTDPRFCTLGDRSRNVAEWCATLSEMLGERATAEWLPVFEAAGIPAARVNSTEDLFSDPHLVEVGFFQVVDDAQDGPLRMPRPPVIFNGTPSTVHPGGHALGADTLDVLRELGLSTQQINELSDRGIVGIKTPEEDTRLETCK
jgi:crotonobetainyl-CoA:carnitine CoA-transferase CaiB-like acyl-CoA transferase